MAPLTEGEQDNDEAVLCSQLRVWGVVSVLPKESRTDTWIMLYLLQLGYCW